MGFFIGLFLGSMLADWDDKNFDIREYFNKPYCQEVKLGGQLIKKCWVVVEKP
jgi:hypothetical protein